MSRVHRWETPPVRGESWFRSWCVARRNFCGQPVGPIWVKFQKWSDDLFGEPGSKGKLREVASNFIQNLSEIFSRPGVRRMNPPRSALYSRYAVFGMHCCWGVLGMRDPIIPGWTAAIACVIGMSPPI
jgi:hypothetical protein